MTYRRYALPEWARPAHQNEIRRHNGGLTNEQIRCVLGGMFNQRHCLLGTRSHIGGLVDVGRSLHGSD